ncbi:MAG: FkbM family methyltransferase [Candidatus Electrothrix gigas]
MKKQIHCWLQYCRYLSPWLGIWTLFLKQLKIERFWGNEMRPIFRPLRFVLCYGLQGLSILRSVDRETELIEDAKSEFTFYCRPSTADYRVFEHIFIDRVYNIRLDKSKVLRIVDGGANVGFSSLFFAEKFPESHIVAIEPDSDNLHQLKKNCLFCKRISPLAGAIWFQSGQVWIENPSAASWSFRVGKNKQEGGEALNAYGVDDIMERFQWAAIDLLKLDVEGAEREIFCEEADGWLKKVGCVICELHEEKISGCFTSFHNAMTRNGFDVIYYNENASSIGGAWLSK